MATPSLFDRDVLKAMLARIESLRPDSQRQWGKMTVAQMLDIVSFLKTRFRHIKPLYYDDYYGP